MSLKLIKSPLTISLDINGKNIISGYCCHGKFTEKYKTDTPIYNSQKEDFDTYLKGRLVQEIYVAVEQCQLTGEESFLSNNSFVDVNLTRIPIGISFSGQVSADGEIYSASSIFRGEHPLNFNLRDLIKKMYPHRDIYVLNNISAVTWKYSEEKFFEQSTRFLVVHVGSGFGSKVFDNVRKEVVIDKGGLSGELGHISIVKEDNLKHYRFMCDCGKENHLAAFLLPEGMANLFVYFNQEYCDKHPGYQRFMVDKNNVLDLIEENFHTFGIEVLRYVSNVLGRVIAIFILSIGIDKLIIKGSQFYKLKDAAVRKFFISELTQQIRYFIGDYFKIGDDFIVERFSDESNDRRDSLEGLYVYINSVSSSTSKVIGGYLCGLPGFEISSVRNISYSVVRTSNLFAPENLFLKDILGTKKALIVIDNNYDQQYGNKLRAELYCYFMGSNTINIVGIDPGNERVGEQKEMSRVIEVIEEATKYNLPRDGVLVAIGGGVVLDIVGFAAQQYRRMIDYIKIPTTLVGQIDAGIGVKVGVNYKGHKNLIGAFYPPLITINHIPFLFDLPDSQMECGIAEILKVGIIDSENIIDGLNNIDGHLSGARLSTDMETRNKFILIMDEAIEKMLVHLQKNLFEREDLRRHVDFGHLFSPVIESSSKYIIPHGYAVAIDMLISCFISRELGLITDEIFCTYKRLLDKFGLFIYPAILEQRFSSIFDESVENTIQHRCRNLNLVVPLEKIGHSGFINLIECDDKNTNFYCMVIPRDELKRYYMKAIGFIKSNAHRKL